MQSTPPADAFAGSRTARGLHRRASSRLETGEVLLAWTRAWVSIEGKFNVLLAARTRDFVVLSDRRLMLWSTGFFSRRPRRRVLADRLDELTVTRTPPLTGLRLTVRSLTHKTLRLELAPGANSVRLADELTARTQIAVPGQEATEESEETDDVDHRD